MTLSAGAIGIAVTLGTSIAYAVSSGFVVSLSAFFWMRALSQELHAVKRREDFERAVMDAIIENLKVARAACDYVAPPTVSASARGH